jgi:hypothetical protein
LLWYILSPSSLGIQHIHSQICPLIHPVIQYTEDFGRTDELCTAKLRWNRRMKEAGLRCCSVEILEFFLVLQTNSLGVTEGENLKGVGGDE